MKPSAGSLAVRVFVVAAFLCLCAFLSSQPAPPERVGPLPGGGFLLSSGWRLQPAGRQIPLDTFPMSTVMSPDNKYLLVLNAGYRPPSVTVLDAASGRVVSTTPVPDGWLGLTFGPGTNRVYVGGASKASVFEFTFGADGKLSAGRTFALVEKPVDADFVGDVSFSPDGRLLYCAQLYRDSIAVINPQSGMVINRIRTKRRPYRILFHPDGKSFFVTHWADGSMGHYDATNGSTLADLRLGAHPTDIVWREGGPGEVAPGEPTRAGRLFVAAANTNSVYTIGVSAAKDLNVVEKINISMTPNQPLGMTPSALALSADKERLFVVCSDGNVVAVADVSGERSNMEGFIPAGWYPTAVRTLPSGGLVILNGKGAQSYPNPNGPNPTKGPAPVYAGDPGRGPGYVAFMQAGTASWLDPFSDDQLDAWTRVSFANSPYRDEKLDELNPLPPIEHVIYIVKENRTYDQVLGDVKPGNGDPSLVLFGENITPNLHKLAREFVLLDNFYVNSDVSADGHNWSTAAIAPDYVQKIWPNRYANRRKTNDMEEGDAASLPPANYLWTNAAMAGISIRNFGYMANNKPGAAMGTEQVLNVRDPVLAKVTNPMFRGWDLDYPDVERAKVFLAELAQYEKAGEMPRLIVMRLGNDHTNGTTPGKIAPLSAAADNDYAVGMLVEGLSKSRFWSSTAIFILEDDAQNGPDHVDSHRSTAYVISPYIKRHTVDSTMYNTTSMLRTIEFILGLRPMTQFDAASRPIAAPFLKTADASPYTAEKPRVALDARNPANAPGAGASKQMDFDDADEIDESALNDILWRAIRHDAPPPPVRSYFAK